VVVPAIGSGYDEQRNFATVDLQIQFLGALVEEDAVAEGWITQRGRSIVFCEAEVVGAHSLRKIARGMLTYKVSRSVPA
jgi:acyl-coenzyme A thioesterase PaaI-like protein